MGRLDGKRVLVTGAAGAVGRAVLGRLREEGAAPFAVDRPGARSDVSGVPFAEADLTAEHEAVRAVEAAVRELGGLDGLACLAGGFIGDRTVLDTPLSVVKHQFELNVVTAYTVTRAALPFLLSGGSGAIVYVSSRPALQPVRGSVAYAMAKLALVKLAEVVTAEYREQGVRANAIAPSIIDTPANRAAMPKADPTRWVRPEEVAGLVAYLLSDASRSVGGTVVPIYGRA